MLITIMDIQKLLKIQNKQEEKQYQVYDEIYKKLCNKINYIAENGKISMEYDIPLFLVGKPSYNYEDVIKYIKKKLRKRGLIITSVNNTLFISWEKEEVSKRLKQIAEIKDKKKAIKEAERLQNENLHYEKQVLTPLFDNLNL